MFEWQFQLAQDVDSEDTSLLEEIHRVFLDGFSLSKGWSIEGIGKRLKTTNVVGFLKGEEKLYGYAFYSAPNELLDGTYLLWEDGICLKKEVQGKNLTRQVIEKASSIFPNRHFGWIGGRTQNPVVIKRYSKLGGALFPFDVSYSSSEGKLLMGHLLEYIEEVKEVHKVQKLDLTNGVCRKIYREGHLGIYPIEVTGTATFEKQLNEWDFQRDSGDAVIIVSKLS